MQDAASILELREEDFRNGSAHESDEYATRHRSKRILTKMIFENRCQLEICYDSDEFGLTAAGIFAKSPSQIRSPVILFE